MSQLILPTDPAFHEALETKALERGFHRYSVDRYGRKVLAYNAQGKPYEACPMCSRKATVRTVLNTGDILWNCEYCGYDECAECPFGIHQPRDGEEARDA